MKGKVGAVCYRGDIGYSGGFAFGAAAFAFAVFQGLGGGERGGVKLHGDDANGVCFDVLPDMVRGVALCASGSAHGESVAAVAATGGGVVCGAAGHAAFAGLVGGGEGFAAFLAPVLRVSLGAFDAFGGGAPFVNNVQVSLTQGYAVGIVAGAAKRPPAEAGVCAPLAGLGRRVAHAAIVQPGARRAGTFCFGGRATGTGKVARNRVHYTQKAVRVRLPPRIVDSIASRNAQQTRRSHVVA